MKLSGSFYYISKTNRTYCLQIKKQAILYAAETLNFKGLTRLEQQNCNLAKIEINKVLRFVGDIGAKVAADNAVPSGVVLLVKFLLNVSRNILYTMENCKTGEHAEGCVSKSGEILHTFSMLYFSKAWDAQSTASCCISSDMSAFLMTALRSAIIYIVVD